MIGRRLRRSAVLASAVLLIACGPRSPDELMAAARTALAEDERRTAEIHLRNLLQQAPDHTTGRALLGELLVQSDPVGAEHNLRRAIEVGADPAALQLPLLRALAAQGKFDALLEQIAAGPELDQSDRVEVHMLAGLAHRALDSPEAAEAAYRAALEIEPASAAARVELATLLLATGRLDEARSLAAAVNAEQPEYVPALLALGMLEGARSRYADAVPWFQEAVRLEEQRGKGPGYVRALAPLIEAQLTLRDLDLANSNAAALLAADASAPIGRYLKARIEFELGDAASADQRLQALIADVPSFWQAYVVLGMVKAAQEQLGQAEMFLRTAVANVPQNTMARLLLAEIYLRQNNVTSARAVLADARDVVGDGLAAALVGRASLAAGEAELAAQFFDRSEQKEPANVRELVELAGVYVTAGQLDRAARVLESASFDGAEGAALIDYLLSIVQLRRGDAAAAAVTAERLSDELPAAAWPLALRGAIAATQGDQDGARRFFEKALEREPAYVPALLSLARMAAAGGDSEGAAAYLRRVLDVDPQRLDAIVGMVQLAVQRGDFAEAETWLASAPESAQRFALEGNLHAAQRRYAEAAAAFDKAFELQPSAGLALQAYGASRQAGRPNADAPLLAWLERSPNDPDVNFALGSHALERGDSAAAIARYEAVIAANPQHGPALNNLAWLYDQTGDDRALDFARRAHSVLPDDPSVADTLGWLYVRRGDAAVGLPFLERAARDTSDPEIRYHYAVALADTGAVADATAILEQLLSGTGDFASRAEARERLSRLRQTP